MGDIDEGLVSHLHGTFPCLTEAYFLHIFCACAYVPFVLSLTGIAHGFYHYWVDLCFFSTQKVLIFGQTIFFPIPSVV